MWNYKTCKEQLGFRQQTYAHRLHLDKILAIKSSIDHKNRQWTLLKNNKGSNKRLAFLQRSRLQEIDIQNSTLLQRIANIEKLKQLSNQKLKHSPTYSDHIQNSLGRKRNKIFNDIKSQNSFKASRIQQVNPTLTRTSWQGDQAKTKKYKQNICVSRFAKPDYTAQANRIKAKKNDSFDHLRFTKIDHKQLPKLSRSIAGSRANRSIHQIINIRA